MSRKYILRALTLLFLISFTVSAAEGRDYTVRRKIDNYTVDVAINRNPPRKYIANAAVSVNYYMPPMPGMPPMNYTVKAAPSGSGYSAVMDLIMTGPWNIAIRMGMEGKVLRLMVPIDAR